MKILLCGGGTGGHIFPGVALYEEFVKHKQSEILFVCSNREIDRKILNHYKIKYISIDSLGRTSFMKFPLLIYRLISSLFHANEVMRKFSPDVVIGLGGFASFCCLTIAILRRKKIFLLEQNFIPGLVNKIFIRFAEQMYTQFEIHPSLKRFEGKIKIYGNPIRSDIKVFDRNEAKKRLNLDVNKKTIGIFGGSQGADFLNQIPLSFGTILEKYRDKINVIHTAGKNVNAVKKGYETSGIEAYVVDFVFEMGLIYSACDIVISRAGGNAIAELKKYKIPVIFVPFPHATENHQFFNALQVEKDGFVTLVKQSDIDSGRFEGLLNKFFEEVNAKTSHQNFDFTADFKIVSDILRLTQKSNILRQEKKNSLRL